jgi:signal transduction histidine kinase
MRLRYMILFIFILIGNKTMANEYIFPGVQYKIDSLKQTLLTQHLSEKQKMEIYLRIGNEYQSFELDSSTLYTTQCMMLAQKLKDHEMLMKAYLNLGVNYCFKGDFDRAFSYFDQTNALAIKYGNKKHELSAIRLTGYAYAKQGKFNMALDYFLKCLTIYENERWTNDHNYLGTLTNICEINRRLGNTETAILYLKKAEEKMNMEPPDFFTLAHVWNEFAFNYLKQGDWEKALHYVLKSEERHGGGTVNFCYAKGILATIYLQQNDYNRALEYAKESQQLAELLNDFSLHAYAGKILSDVYLALKRYPEAEAAVLKVLDSCATYSDDILALVENIAMANIYMGNREKAAHYLKKYSEINAQYSEKSYQTFISDLAIKYETEKKELRIAALEEERKFYTWLSLACAATLLLAIGLLSVRHRLNVQKRKIAEQQVKQLEQEKQLIATQAELDGETAERSRLARDLHDGLGGMLSVVKLNLKDIKPYAIMDGADVEHFGKALDILDQSIGELRRVAHHIMPESLMRCGLKVSLEDFCRAIPVAHFQYLGDNSRLDSRLEILIYRCAYELVNNAVKHARATAINVQLMLDNGVISLTVNDNGVGFDPQTTDSGMGLVNIRTRIAGHNGKMNILSSPESGTEVCIEIEQTKS